MRKIALIIFMLMAVAYQDVKAQQDPGYSMYMFNGLVLNPAYAGSREQVSITGIYRHQWAGMAGAPRVISFSAHTPLPYNRVGVGLSVSNDRIGVTNALNITTDYAYRIPIGKGKLSLGVRAQITNYRARWNELVFNDVQDYQDLTDNPNLWLPNFGPGVYWYMPRFYAGVSVPHLLNHSLDEQWSLEGTKQVARQFRHYFATTGVVIPLGQHVQFRPSVLVKYVQAAPMQADFNASFLFMDALWVGASYRTGDSFIGMIEYLFAKHFRAGYAYDYTVTPLNNYTSGSHEIMIGYEFGVSSDKYLTPRRMNYF